MHAVRKNNTIRIWKYKKAQKQGQDVLTVNFLNKCTMLIMFKKAKGHD